MSTSCVSEALYGEQVLALERRAGWTWVRQTHDAYEGWLLTSLLTPSGQSLADSTHRVTHRSTLLFSAADIKSPVLLCLPFGAELTLVDAVGDSFSRTEHDGYVWTSHCLPLDRNHPSGPLELARSHFLGCPYRWGGRSPEGADCSGLIQALARSQGLAIPRDSRDQETYIGPTVNAGDYQAGDIVYWPGHCGILTSADLILHATAYSLDCIIEPLAEVIRRAGPISSVKRLFA
jgi:cell wall-associated NlpC family hydrolase